MCNLLPKVFDIPRCRIVECLDELREYWFQQSIPQCWFFAKSLQSLETTKHFLPVGLCPQQGYRGQAATYATSVREVFLHGTHHNNACCCLVRLGRGGESWQEPFSQRRVDDVLFYFLPTSRISMMSPHQGKSSVSYIWYENLAQSTPISAFPAITGPTSSCSLF
jgi:hypothetical protein